MSLVLHFFLYTSFFCQLPIPGSAHILRHDDNDIPNQCSTKCGNFSVPLPFYFNSSSSSSSCSPNKTLLPNAFSLSCINSTSLFLNIASETYRVLQFFPDGVLVDFPNTSTCRQYNDLKSFSFSGNEYFGISTDNVVDLYDCEDSSLCKTDCERNINFVMPGCDDDGGPGPSGSSRHPSCCYPLSDRSAWRPAHSSFSDFLQFGCRGFSSWVVLPGTATAKRGVKLEWAVPRNATQHACAENADTLNATSVKSGIRCQCPDGFVGDGYQFPVGLGCLKSCFKDGKEVHGSDCYRNHHGRKKAIILAGVLSSSVLTIILMAFCLLKSPKRSHRFDVSDQSHCQSAIFSQKEACRSRLFTYHELEEATKGFEDEQKLADNMYAGVLIHSHSRIAVQKIECESESDLIRVLFRLEALSAVSHRNMSRIIGWSMDSPLLIVYDYPQNGTFKEHLRLARDEHIPLDWHKRLNIAAETAAILAFLHYEISPPIFHHHLQSSCIFLDRDFSVQLAGFDLHNDANCSSTRNDVYSFGLILLEMITGNTVSMVNTALQKIKKGKVEEIVDPSLYYHEQQPFRREQIEIIADLATRCLLFGSDGRMGMADVARELLHITKDSVDGSGRRKSPALEETFSNSSLLQMISMSPDSIHLPQHGNC